MSQASHIIAKLERGFGRAGPLAFTWAITLLIPGLAIIWLHLSYEGVTPSGKVTTIAQPDTPISESEKIHEADRIGEKDKAHTETATAKSDMEDGPPITAIQPDMADPTGNSVSNPNNGDKLPSAIVHLGLVPDPALIEQSAHGPLPVIGADGKKPWHAYRRPYLGPKSGPRIALVMQEIGLSQKSSRLAIDRLPPEVTLAISPYGQTPQSIVEDARAAGHEVLLMVPMEPVAYPANDPGPHSLLVSLPAAENLDRLHYVMSRIQGYAGIVNHMGSRFTANRDTLAPILSDIGRRGLMLVDARTSTRSVMASMAQELAIPTAVNDRYIDNDVSATAIDRYLADLETIAKERGTAIGFARPYPLTIERIISWKDSLALKGITLAPVTAIAETGDGSPS